MRLAVFGATGRVGRRLVEYATGEGHTVRALVRDPARLPAATGCTGVVGEVTDLAAVQSTLQGADAVLSALGGAGLANPGTAVSDGMHTIVRAMEAIGVTRVLAVAGSGVLDDPRGGLRADAADFPAIYGPITREHRGTWDALRGSELAWTLICCPDLVDGERIGRYRAVAKLLPPKGASISVEDVAGFMLRQVRDDGFIRQRVGVAY